jgi:hypothetical protein
MSLVRARRRHTAARRPRARQSQGHPGRKLGDHHSDALPPTSVTRTFEATRDAGRWSNRLRTYLKNLWSALLKRYYSVSSAIPVC